MANRNLKPIAAPNIGEKYDLLTCSWCGGPAPVFADKRGRPFIRCPNCGCRSFGTGAAIEVARMRGLLDEQVEWPVMAAV